MINLTRIQEIEKAAWEGGVMPVGLDVFEQVYWHGMTMIFHNYRIKAIDSAEVKECRKSLLTEVENLRKEVAACGDDQGR